MAMFTQNNNNKKKKIQSLHFGFTRITDDLCSATMFACADWIVGSSI